MAEQQDQDRSEEPTPFKLKRAREKGQVARGMDLGFVGSLVAFSAFLLLAGSAFAGRLSDLMRLSFTAGISGATDPRAPLAHIGDVYWLAFEPLLVLGGTVIVVLVLLDLLQLGGFLFTAQPLKPDFSRLNPAKGLKRLFSLKMLKETLKNIVKMAAYAFVAWLVVRSSVATFADSVVDAHALERAMEGAGKRLLFAFLGLAILFMAIDQFIVRREYLKQMRMSRRELTRESKEREGEPRMKAKRREIHAEMRRQAEGLGNVAGSDFIITNPEHFAVALAYEPEGMNAPTVRARGRNLFAQLLKRKARLLAVPVIADPVLARRLYRDCRPGQEIPAHHFHAVARHYARLRRMAARTGTPEHG